LIIIGFFNNFVSNSLLDLDKKKLVLNSFFQTTYIDENTIIDFVKR